MACGELATAAQERIPLTILLVDDGGYGMLRFDAERASARSPSASTSPRRTSSRSRDAFGIDARARAARRARAGARRARRAARADDDRRRGARCARPRTPRRAGTAPPRRRPHDGHHRSDHQLAHRRRAAGGHRPDAHDAQSGAPGRGRGARRARRRRARSLRRARAARAAQPAWAAVPAPVRGEAIANLSRLVEDNKRGARRARHAGDRQAARRGARRGPGGHRHLPLLPRRGPAPLRADGSQRDARQAPLHLPRAGRRRGDHHRRQLPGRRAELVHRAGAAVRQRRRLEAGRLRDGAARTRWRGWR